jgi:hypothetical protein
LRGYQGISAVGEVEPLVSRAWAQKSGPGHTVSNLGICYAPGSFSSSEQKFFIADYGIWKQALPS